MTFHFTPADVERFFRYVDKLTNNDLKVQRRKAMECRV